MLFAAWMVSCTWESDWDNWPVAHEEQICTSARFLSLRLVTYTDTDVPEHYLILRDTFIVKIGIWFYLRAKFGSTRIEDSTCVAGGGHVLEQTISRKHRHQTFRLQIGSETFPINIFYNKLCKAVGMKKGKSKTSLSSVTLLKLVPWDIRPIMGMPSAQLPGCNWLVIYSFILYHFVYFVWLSNL